MQGCTEEYRRMLGVGVQVELAGLRCTQFSLHINRSLITSATSKIAYNGAPAKAYEVFVNALNTKYLSEGYIIPELENQNPAGQLTPVAVIAGTLANDS